MRAVDNKMTNTAQSVCEVSSENGSGNVILHSFIGKRLHFFTQAYSVSKYFFVVF